MAQVQGSPSYTVQLRTDGSWNWRLSLSTKTQSDFYTKFPPDKTPSFLVDLGPGYKSLKADQPAAQDKWPWKVISVQELPYDADPSTMHALMKEGWAAISYAWGEYLPTNPYKHRPVFDGSRADNGLPLAYVPLGATAKQTQEYNWPMHKSTEPTLSLDNFRKVLVTLGKRFFWWDLACLPQSVASKGFAPDPDRKDANGVPTPYYGQPSLSNEMWDLISAELAKQKFVYDRATVGAVWVHSLDWTTNSKTKQLLLKAPALLDITTVKSMIHDATDPAYGKPAIIETILKSVLGLAANADATAWLTAINAFVADLKQARLEEAWFRSLWSFQEGKLLKKQAFLDAKGQVLSLPQTVSVSGQSFAFPNIKIKSGDRYFDSSSPDDSDITNIATLLASQISIAYVSQKVPSLVPRSIPALVELWKQPNPPLNGVVPDIISTGMVYFTEDMPLERIIAARRSRYPSFRYADAFYAMIGVLGLIKSDAEHDYEMIDTGKYDKYGGDRDIAFVKEEVAKNFFEALIRKYQWMILLLAKKPVEPIASWRAISLGHFEVINPYCEGFLIGNDIKDKGASGDDFYPPLLAYDINEDAIIITPPKGFVTKPIVPAAPVGVPAPTVIEYPKKQLICWSVKNVVNVLSGPKQPSLVPPGFAAAKPGSFPIGLLLMSGVYSSTFSLSTGLSLVTPLNDPPTMNLYTLADDAVDYVDPFVKSGGYVDDKPDKTTRTSNTVIVRPANLIDAGKPTGDDGILLIPFRSLEQDLLRSYVGDASAQPAPSRPRFGRCVLLKNVVYDQTKNTICSGTFGGIVDVSKLECTEKAMDKISMKWQ